MMLVEKILEFFKEIWKGMPRVLRFCIIVIASFILIFLIPNNIIRFILSTFFIIYLVFDIIIPYIKNKIDSIRRKRYIKEEEKRIEKVISGSTKKSSPKEYYNLHFPYNFKIRNTTPKNKDHFIDIATKTLILKEHIKENKSKNLANFISYGITVGYLPHLWEYFSPKLAELIVYEKIRDVLEKTDDIEAMRVFTSDYDLNSRGLKEKDRECYHFLMRENSFNEIFLPILFYLKNKEKMINTALKNEIEGFFYWLGDRNKNLIYSTKYLPRMGYVYIKKLGMPLHVHKKRVIKNFEDHGCELCILGAFKELYTHQNTVSEEIKERYPLLKIFNGKSLDKMDRERDAKYLIHKHPDSDLILNMDFIPNI